ncbi:hypothetical protein Taro_020919, partial [Colocasia esculenta]|nr:hypothetical protein [Colocasia esculenta]
MSGQLPFFLPRLLLGHKALGVRPLLPCHSLSGEILVSPPPLPLRSPLSPITSLVVAAFLDCAHPFNITQSNTIFYLNCTQRLLLSLLNCIATSPCHAYVNATAEGANCRQTARPVPTPPAEQTQLEREGCSGASATLSSDGTLSATPAPTMSPAVRLQEAAVVQTMPLSLPVRPLQAAAPHPAAFERIAKERQDILNANNTSGRSAKNFTGHEIKKAMTSPATNSSAPVATATSSWAASTTVP